MHTELQIMRERGILENKLWKLYFLNLKNS